MYGEPRRATIIPSFPRKNDILQEFQKLASLMFSFFAINYQFQLKILRSIAKSKFLTKMGKKILLNV